jgi:acyl-CoA thioesterase
VSAPVADDAFAALLGIDVEPGGHGTATARVHVSDDHTNPHGTAHGALIFAVAGAALAAAANDDDHSGVVASTHIDYLARARVGDVLVAHAEVAERLLREDVFVVRVVSGSELVARVSARATRRPRHIHL